ncbi:MAG: hypothetical protein BWX79_02313 [Alphaproteobacteria bacterium ADurb.Bin100]|nr:MAG: hypothetical protein BWX79_02313 [Alphaproteobacteria bacterium ADurb.Bin100]
MRSAAVPCMKPMPPRICTAASAQNCMVWVAWFLSRQTCATHSAPLADLSPLSPRAVTASSQARVDSMRIFMSINLWRITW